MKTKVILAFMIAAIFNLSYSKKDPGLNSPMPINKISATDLSSINDSTTDNAELTTKPYSAAELKHKWQSLTKGKEWNKLMKELDLKGMKRIEDASYGFSGTLKEVNSGKVIDVDYCVFDFYSPGAKKDKSFQTGSMVYRKIGNEIYKAYIVFPKGESDVQKSFAAAEEWFVDATDEVKKAHSFGSCFNRCVMAGKHSVSIPTLFGTMKVTANCATSCLTAVVVCGGVTAILEVASGGLGTPVLIATFGICAGVACASCFAYCALSSLSCK